MILYPAIDLRGGHCVRLTEGDFGRETVYGDDPVAMAERWAAAGARWLHVVDLDGARAGKPVQLDIIRAICAAVAVPVQVGGGLRDAEAVEQLLAAGVQRAIVGTMAARDPERCRAICQRWPGRIAAGIDARDGLVRVAGWLEGEAMEATVLAGHVAAMGAAAIIFTDIARDGTQHGVNVAATAAVARAAAGVPVIASGGIGTAAHLHEVARLAGDGVGGVIVGRALYTGAVTIEAALAAVEGV
jgi:phosphoribosylformimino-5-aminoimidazole carboxamide ribotide isomerase